MTRRVVAGGLLAAGASRRLGSPKALLVRDGVTLVEQAARCLIDACPGPVWAVVRDGAGRDVALLKRLAVTCLVHPDADRGMGTSLARLVAAAAAVDPAPEALVVAVVDQPGLSADHVGRLIHDWDGRPAAAVASRYSGVTGVPALFGRDWFSRLAGLDGPRGARDLLRESPDVTTIDWPAGAFDLDDPHAARRAGWREDLD